MALVVNSNISSLNAQRQLVSSGAELDKASERLASGKRINSAADDAAGLAISNRQTSQIRGLDQAVRNANDGVSLIQTAEGALDETTNILQRMRELAIQSANGIYSDTDRATLDAETQQLKAEIDRIAETTSFNGQNILDGSLGTVALQVGAQANQTISFDVQGFSSSSLGGAAGDVVSEATTGIGALTALDTDGDLVINDVNISATDGAGTLNEALAIMNADLDGKGVEVSSLVSSTANDAGDGQLIAGTDRLDITVTDGDGLTHVYQLTGTSSMDELVEKINSDTTVTASLNDSGKLVLAQEDATSIVLAAGAGAGLTATGFDGAETDEQFRLVLTDTSADGNGVKIESGTITAAELLALGLNDQDDNGNLQGATVTTAATGTTLNEGDLIINGVEIGQIDSAASAALTTDEVIIAINKLSTETGVVAYEVGGDDDRIALSSTTGDEVSIKYGDNATAANIVAMTGFEQRNAAEGAGSVSGVDISTAAGAQSAVEVIDKALEQINTSRSELGAINNRLDFTVSNLSNVSEKTSAARSRIVDADFASETANLSRAQVLQQASQAMLAQANARPQQVLSLLQ